MRYCLAIVVLACFFITPVTAQELSQEDIIKIVEDRITSVESYAVIFTIKWSRYTDERGQVYPAYKKYALAARGPYEFTDTADNTMRVYEEFLWFGDGRNPNTKPMHRITYYDGTTMHKWNSNDRIFKTDRLLYFNLITPPHYTHWLETIMVYPLHRFLTMKPCNILMRDNKVDYEKRGQTIEFQTEFGPNNRLKHKIEFHQERGIKRIVQTDENSSHENIVDQYEEVNGIPIPARGRVVYDTHLVRMNMVEAKINDQVPEAAFKVLPVPEKNEQSDFPYGGHPTYFNQFFDMNLQEVFQKYMNL